MIGLVDRPASPATYGNPFSKSPCNSAWYLEVDLVLLSVRGACIGRLYVEIIKVGRPRLAYTPYIVAGGA